MKEKNKILLYYCKDDDSPLKIEVGDFLTLKIPCMGNQPGTKGAIYDVYVYSDDDEPTSGGISVISPEW